MAVNPDDLFHDNDTPDEKAYKMLKVMTRAINTNEKGETWEPDYNNPNQKKWFPWFKVRSSGFGFGASGYGYYFDYTHLGARLAFETKEQSDFAGKMHTIIYEQFLMTKK